MSLRFATVSRRAFLRAGAAMIGAGAVSVGHALAFEREPNRGPTNTEVPAVKALVFDVFGTVVDWRTSVTREVEELAKQKGLKVDPGKFADAWRAGYGPSMDRVRKGELPWTKLDDLHRMILDQLLKDFGIAGLSEA